MQRASVKSTTWNKPGKSGRRSQRPGKFGAPTNEGSTGKSGWEMSANDALKFNYVDSEMFNEEHTDHTNPGNTL